MERGIPAEDADAAEVAVGLREPGLVAVRHHPDRGPEVGYEHGLADGQDLESRGDPPVVAATVTAGRDDADPGRQSQIRVAHIDELFQRRHTGELRESSDGSPQL